MTAYYNENDPAAAEWLRNLIGGGLIADGEVDERSIRDVRPDDVRGFDQCHWFAGVGGWAYACRLAGIPDDFPIWTGSCPCQPLSVAGKQRGHADDRHLWPAFFRLIAECAPAICAGEQVGGALGYEWLAGVQLDLEDAGFAFSAADLPAASVGAPHRRERLFWCGLGHADRAGLAQWGGERGDARAERPAAERADGGGGLANTESVGRTGWHAGAVQGHGQSERAPIEPERRDGGGFWRDAEWFACHDGKARRAEPRISLLADGISGRLAVSRPGTEETREISRTAAWRGFGNAIVPQLGAVFLRAVMGAAA